MEVWDYTANIVATILLLGYINIEQISLYRLTTFKMEFLPNLVHTI
jgi:hypothetical protein